MELIYRLLSFEDAEYGVLSIELKRTGLSGCEILKLVPESCHEMFAYTYPSNILWKPFKEGSRHINFVTFRILASAYSLSCHVDILYELFLG